MIAWWIWVIIGVVVCAAASVAVFVFAFKREDIGRYLKVRKKVSESVKRREVVIFEEDDVMFGEYAEATPEISGAEKRRRAVIFEEEDDALFDEYEIFEESAADRDEFPAGHDITNPLEKIAKSLLNAKQLMAARALERAAREAVKSGFLIFNVPVKMIQGEEERVEVKITRSARLREEMLSELRASRGEPLFEEIDTSLYMEVKLAGPSFDVTSHSPSEQIIIPKPACWEFQVLPFRAGKRQLTLSVSMRIEAKGIAGGRRGVTVLEKQIDVQVNIPYATNRFVASNWQWLIPTVLALAGTVAAWLVVPF
jgi:hypothetical protein